MNTQTPPAKPVPPIVKNVLGEPPYKPAIAAALKVMDGVCQFLSTFMQHRVDPKFRGSPLEGAASAGLIREIPKLAEMIEREMGATQGVRDAETPRFVFNKDGTCSPLSGDIEPGIPNPDYATPTILDRIRELLAIESLRFGAAAKQLGITPEQIREAIALPESGLTIAAGGWIQVAKADPALA